VNNLDVLIVSSGHHHEDGRLIRHKNSLTRSGLSAEIKTIHFSNRLMRFISGPFLAFRIIKQHNPKSVILPDPELQLVLPILLRKKLPVISDVHENYEMVRFDRSWAKTWMIPLIKLLTKVLSFVRTRFSDTVLTADKQICPEADYVITNRPNPKDLPDPAQVLYPRTLVYVGDIRESRGLEMMLDLVNDIPELHLKLIGPSNVPMLEKILVDKGLSDRVVWYGRTPYEQSWKVARECLAGLSLLSDTPAFRKAQPTKIWEYWTVGIPVLATEIPGQESMIKEAGGGVTGTYETLTKTICNWLDSPEDAYSLGAKGRDYILKTANQRDQLLSKAIQETIASCKE